MDTLPTLRGERVLLRQLVPDDVDALLDIFGDERVVRYMALGRLRDRSHAERFLESIHASARENELYQWGVARLADDRVVGTCTLYEINLRDERAAIGFALGRAHWGNGYMREALPLLLEHAFDSLALNRLDADVDPRNAASLRVLERVGFRREGLVRECYLHDGERQDSVILGLLAREWRDSRHSESTE